MLFIESTATPVIAAPAAVLKSTRIELELSPIHLYLSHDIDGVEQEAFCESDLMTPEIEHECRELLEHIERFRKLVGIRMPEIV